MDSFSTLRSILATCPSPDSMMINSTKESQRDDTSNSNRFEFPPKVTNKRKAAFEAWHRKKLAQMKNGGEIETSSSSSSTTRRFSTSDSYLKRFLSSPPSSVAMSNDIVSKIQNGEIGGKRDSNQLTTAAKTLTAPKLSRHNDAAFYPNIQCILCHEWVCSRNRYMHIESHFQYRPYKCSVCGYDNRKQIFIELHINRVHKGAAQILYHPDSELEKRAWTMAERCLQHTREVLLRRELGQNVQETSFDEKAAAAAEIADPVPSTTTTTGTKSEATVPLVAPYTGVYRPKIYNNQRSEKSNLIEESRMLGLIPDFSDVTAREERCRLCDCHVLRTPNLLEEHARTHLSRPSYGCSVNACPVLHHNRNFITRHMKEVHRIRKGVNDLLEQDRRLLNEYLTTCCRCFPEFFAPANGVSKGVSSSERFNKSKSIANNSTTTISTASTGGENDRLCLGCVHGLNLFADYAKDGKCVCCRFSELEETNSTPELIFFCELCNDVLVASDRQRLVHEAESHSLRHCFTMPFQCAYCPFSHWRQFEFERHFQQSHNNSKPSTFFRWQTIVDWRRMWKNTFEQCFNIQEEEAKKCETYVQCRECTAMVLDLAHTRFQHSLLRHRLTSALEEHQLHFRCAYCDFRENDEQSFVAHSTRLHPDRPMLKSFSISFRENVEIGLNRIRISYGRCFENSKTQKRENASSTPKTTFCRLCHSNIADEPTSHVVHLQFHCTAPIYRCRACAYVDIDVDRVKRHVDDEHDGKVPYYAEQLPFDQESKAFRLMELCFQSSASQVLLT